MAGKLSVLVNNLTLKLTNREKRFLLSSISVVAGAILIPISIGFLYRSFETGLFVFVAIASAILLAAVQLMSIWRKYKIDLETRGIEASFREYLRASLTLTLFYDLLFFVVSVIVILLFQIRGLEIDFRLLFLAGNAMIIMVDVGMVLWPQIPVKDSKKFRKLRPDEYPQLTSLIERSGIRVHSIGFLPLSKFKVINAYQSGGIERNSVIAISDYLEQVLTENELAAIVAHEVGHIKYRHLIKKVVAFSIVPAVCLNFYILYRLLNFGQFLSESLQLLLLIALAVLVIGGLTFVLPWLSRRWETQADLYAAELIGAEVYVSALKKLVDNEVVNWKIDRRIEFLLDHPSLHRRANKVGSISDETGG